MATKSTPVMWTPGPWVFQEAQARDIRLKRLHWVVGQAGPPEKGVGFAFGDDEANARLIAAAPELYRACEGLLEALDRAMDYIGNGYQPEDIVAEAREARDQAERFLAKARGETP